MNISVISPTLSRSGKELDLLGSLVQRGAADRLWLGQVELVDPHSMFAALSGRLPGVRSGTSVTLTPLRHPFEAALQARTVASLTQRSFVAGFGPGPSDFQRALNGRAYARPIVAMREYVYIVRTLLRGEHVTFEGEYFACDSRLTPMSAPSIEIGLGVLRSRMGELAGEVADVAIAWLAPPKYLRETLVPALELGATRSRRSSRCRLALMVSVTVERSGVDPLRHVATLTGNHLLAPHYRSVLREEGIVLDSEDAKVSAGRLLESGTALSGSVREVADAIMKFMSTGVDELILNPTSALLDGPNAAADDIESILVELGRA